MKDQVHPILQMRSSPRSLCLRIDVSVKPKRKQYESMA
jgi:hypothetical protein